MLEIALTPAGHLVLHETESAGLVVPPESVLSSLRRSFEQSPSEFLLNLASVRDKNLLPQTFLYWRRLTETYITELCHIPEPAENIQLPLNPPREVLQELSESAPPMRGGEYLTVEILEQFWQELDAYVRQEIASQDGGISKWLQRRNPLWQRIGRVCFHLAENKRNPDLPFAFMATYAPKLTESGRVQYQPLGRALEEYAGSKNKKMLINLLTPVQRAAERCQWIKDLVESGEIFHPLTWRPDEAYHFLSDVPLLEESGLLVRMPDWWAKRSSRIRVGATIGNAKQSLLNADSMLDFKVSLTFEGETLTEQEWQNILSGSDGLVYLKGKWVEVDREKLSHALEQWKRVEQEAGADGISFLQGMRMLAGMPLDAEMNDLLDGENKAWSEVHAGKWLEERLLEIRQPERLRNILPDKELHATLRPYQETGVKWLWLLTQLGLGACLADDMGLGKTIQILSLILMRKKAAANNENKAPSNAVLLVLPASLLTNWKAEIEKFAPSLSFRFVHPSLEQSDALKKAADAPEDFAKTADVVITTYGMLSRLEWLSSIQWNLVVLDEAQAIKNPASRQTRAVKKLKSNAKVVLTGTPVENRLTDLWSMFDFLCPGLLGSVGAFGKFVKRLEDRDRDTDQYGSLRKLVGPYILRRLKTDKSIISDLPDKIEMQSFCNLTQKQAVLYEQSVNELEKLLEAKKSTDDSGIATDNGLARRGLILSFILRFKQICNHPAQWLATGEYAPEESGKFHRLRDICEEISARQEKVLVFTQFREMTEPLARFLSGIFDRSGLVLHGGTSVGKRKEIVDEFQKECGPPFLILSLKAGGTGLNLTSAAHVIHFDRWWNPAVENQATDRAFRIGQKKNVMVHKFVCKGTIEEKIDALIQAKTSLANEVLEGGAVASITEMNDHELLKMVKLDVNTLKED